MKFTKNDKRNKNQIIISTLLTGLLFSGSALAALNAGVTMLEEVKSWLLGLAAVTITIAIMFVGYRMMFNAAQWKDVAPVFWGAVLIGSAAAIAGTLI